MMKTYIADLQATSDAANLRREEAKSKPQGTDTRVLCDTSLTDQIEELMLSLPPALRDRPWTMNDFVPRLQGRYSARPHPMNVGQALRALGWKQRRKWKAGTEGRRVWLPPNAD